MARLAPMLERFHVESIFTLVELGKGIPLYPNHEIAPSMDSNKRDRTIVIRALRLDVVVDDGPIGFALGFAALLAGVTVDLEVGGQLRPRGATFVNGLIKVEPSEPTADLPAMRHGTLLLEKDTQISVRQEFRPIITYRGAEAIPIAFMRVVALSVGTREVM